MEQKILNNFNIRLANLIDLEKIIYIYNQNIKSNIVTADVKKVTIADRLDWFHLHNANNPLWVITQNDTILGWLSLQPFYGRKAYNITKEISIYIAQESAQKGLATLLYNHAVHFCKEHNIENLMAFIFKENTPSIRFFIKNEFKQWGEFPEIAKFEQSYRTLMILGKSIK